MARFHDHPGTPITLRGGREVGVGGELVSLVRTTSTTVARTRIPGQPRDGVFCWDDWKGTALWTGQVRSDSAIPIVVPARNAMQSSSGREIALPSSIVTFVELELGEYVVCWEPRGPDDRNVVCFDLSCEMKWEIGDTPGQPPCAYQGISLQPGNKLEAYAQGRGYLAVVDQRTGVVTTTAPYR